MAGAISGAHNDVEAVPERLARRLNDQGTWHHQELVDLAVTCYAAKTAAG